MAALTDSKGWFLWRTPAAESSGTWLAALEGQRPARVWVLPPGPSFPISSQFQVNPLQLLKCGLDRGPQPWLSGSFPSPELLQAFAAAKWQILQGIGKRKEYDRRKAIINVLLAKSVSRKSCTSGGLSLFSIFNGFCALCWSDWILTRLTWIHLSSSKGKAAQNFYLPLMYQTLAGCWAGVRRYPGAELPDADAVSSCFWRVLVFQSVAGGMCQYVFKCLDTLVPATTGLQRRNSPLSSMLGMFLHSVMGSTGYSPTWK